MKLHKLIINSFRYINHQFPLSLQVSSALSFPVESSPSSPSPSLPPTFAYLPLSALLFSNLFYSFLTFCGYLRLFECNLSAKEHYICFVTQPFLILVKLTVEEPHHHDWFCGFVWRIQERLLLGRIDLIDSSVWWWDFWWVWLSISPQPIQPWYSRGVVGEDYLFSIRRIKFLIVFWWMSRRERCKGLWYRTVFNFSKRANDIINSIKREIHWLSLGICRTSNLTKSK